MTDIKICHIGDKKYKGKRGLYELTKRLLNPDTNLNYESKLLEKNKKSLLEKEKSFLEKQKSFEIEKLEFQKKLDKFNSDIKSLDNKVSQFEEYKENVENNISMEKKIIKEDKEIINTMKKELMKEKKILDEFHENKLKLLEEEMKTKLEFHIKKSNIKVPSLEKLIGKLKMENKLLELKVQQFENYKLISTNINNISSINFNIILSNFEVKNTSLWYFDENKERKTINFIDSSKLTYIMNNNKKYLTPITYDYPTVSSNRYLIRKIQNNKCEQINIKTQHKTILHLFEYNHKKLFNIFFNNMDIILQDPICSNTYGSYCDSVLKNIKDYFPTQKYDVLSYEPNTDISKNMLIQFYVTSKLLNQKTCEIGFHGTDYKNINSILKNGLIINCSRQHSSFYRKGQLYGPGHYFSDDPFYPIYHSYSYPDNNNIYTVIVFIVLTGNIKNYVCHTQETANLIKPPDNYDSVSSVIHNQRCKVVYSDTHCIPIGLLKIKTK